MENPIKSVPNRNPDGTFGANNCANPNGRPKGKTIKERVLEWLEEHPDDMQAFVDHFVKTNRELTWQMLEGRPVQDLQSKGEKINPVPIIEVPYVHKDNRNTENNADDEED